MSNVEMLLRIQTIVDASDDRVVSLKRLAEAIRLSGNYRWVGLYDVTSTEIAIAAWSGPGAPAYPRFPRDKGLSGEVVASRRTVVCNDVTTDPRYLTAFGNTQSEIIIPVISQTTGLVTGTIDVESEHKRAFTETHQASLEACARAAAQLWQPLTRT